MRHGLRLARHRCARQRLGDRHRPCDHGGISTGDLLDVYEELRALPVGAVDVAEVAPRYDPSGGTAQIAARLLFEFLFRTECTPSTFAPWSDSASDEPLEQQ